MSDFLISEYLTEKLLELYPYFGFQIEGWNAMVKIKQVDELFDEFYEKFDICVFNRILKDLRFSEEEKSQLKELNFLMIEIHCLRNVAV